MEKQTVHLQNQRTEQVFLPRHVPHFVMQQKALISTSISPSSTLKGHALKGWDWMKLVIFLASSLALLSELKCHVKWTDTTRWLWGLLVPLSWFMLRHGNVSYLYLCTQGNKQISPYERGNSFDLIVPWNGPGDLRHVPCSLRTVPWCISSLFSSVWRPISSPHVSLLPQSHATKFLPPRLGIGIPNSPHPNRIIFLHNLALSSLPHLIIWKIFLPLVQNTNQSLKNYILHNDLIRKPNLKELQFITSSLQKSYSRAASRSLCYNVQTPYPSWTFILIGTLPTVLFFVFPKMSY